MKYLMMACVVALGAVSHAAADVAAGSGSVNYAESEWRKWSENVSGAAGVRVRFVQTGEHGDDGFRIRRAGGGEVIVSGGKRGVIYGAYELLERFAGVVFCTSWFTYVPESAALSIPPDIDITEKPAFLRREAGWADAFFRHPEFSVRCRFNGWRSHIPESMGGMVVRYGGHMSHSLSALLPPEKYAKDHPEWFSEIDGVRRTAYTQPCFSNDEVKNQVLSNMVAEIRRSPDANVFSISQNDNRNYCRCGRCAAIYEEEGSVAGAMLRFVNAIAEEVEKIRPDLVIQFPAYQDTRIIPKKTKPRHNVMVDLCSIDADFALPLAESDAPGSKEFVELLAGWSKLSKRFYVWHYTTNYRHYLHPLPNIHNIPSDIRLFRDNGATHLHMQGGQSHAAFAELKEWLIAKLSWNPDLDAERLIDVFCRAYYGAGAPFVKEIIADEENCVCSRKVPRMSIFADDKPAVFTDGLLERSRERWRKAEAAVGDDKDRLHHLRMGEMATVTTMMDRIADSAKWVWATEHPENFAQDPRFPELYGWMKVARKEAERTGGVQFSELRANEAWFLEKWDRAMRPNRPAAGAKTGRATADNLCLLQGSGGQRLGRLIDDPAAECGRAIEVFTHKNGDVVKLPFANVAFDNGARYLVRARIRVAKAAGGQGEAFYASITRNWKPVAECFRTVGEVPDGYAWYDIGEVEPKSSMQFCLGCGRFSKGGGRKAVDAVFIDSVEFRKLSAPAGAKAPAAGGLALLSPAGGAVVPLLNPAQKRYLALGRAERAKFFSDDPAVKDGVLKGFGKFGTKPLPVRLEWTPGHGDAAVTVRRVPDGKAFFSQTVSGTNGVEVWNLEIAREWEWTVKSGGGTAKGRFRTEDAAPRFLKIDGIGNCRDLGGRVGLGGRRVRQGMILRTEGMNANAKFVREKGKGELGKILVPPTERGKDRITDEGRRFLLEAVGVKTDLDLRNEYECFGMDGSPLGPSVKFEHHSLIASYSLIKHRMARETLTDVFRLFLRRENYPFVVHCIGGADRTGCIAFALNALLGVQEDELFKDWEATAMVNSFRKGGLADQKHKKWFDGMVKGFDAYPGATICERAVNGIKSLGFTDADIATFREIMLEP